MRRRRKRSSRGPCRGNRRPRGWAAAASSSGPWKVAYVPTQIGQPTTLAWGKGLEAVLKMFPNITYQAFDGQMKAEVQVSVLEDLINQGYNLIVLQPVDAAALSAVVQKAEGKGIPVITLNTPVQAKHTAVVQMADVEAGYAVGVEMCKQLSNKGNVAIIQSPPGATLGVNREKGFRNALAAVCPDVKIVGAQNGEWNKDKAIAIMNAFLQANASWTASSRSTTTWPKARWSPPSPPAASTRSRSGAPTGRAPRSS